MPKKICNHPGCNTLISMKERYCDEHRRETVKRKNSEYDERRRNKKHDRFYHSKEWKGPRNKIMEKHGGLCLWCERIGLTVKAKVVDHIIPLSVDWSLRAELFNLQPLCDPCHAKKTAEDVKTYGRGA